MLLLAAGAGFPSGEFSKRQRVEFQEASACITTPMIWLPVERDFFTGIAKIMFFVFVVVFGAISSWLCSGRGSQAAATLRPGGVIAPPGQLC
ncbi:MAG: hypothetical protein ABI567_05600 [Gammaproteobacteria bacterium]